MMTIQSAHQRWLQEKYGGEGEREREKNKERAMHDGNKRVDNFINKYKSDND